MTATKTKKTTATKTKKTNQNTKYANHPDYEYDTVKTRWVKKSDLRPPELVNRYKAFLTKYLLNHTGLSEKEIKTLVNKHATSTKRLKEILAEKEYDVSQHMLKRFANGKNSFWDKELCHHMEKICPTPTDLKDIKWCDHDEDFFFYYKDETMKKGFCYSINDVLNIISTSLTGGDEELIFLQLPRDPYTRNILSEKFMKAFLKQLRILKNFEIQWPHLVYFLRNYKKFYHDPAIKPFLNKKTLKNEEKWDLSDAIEEFMTRTKDIEHGWTTDNTRWWFWVDEKNQPKKKYNYIFHL